jgi:hypothetical protein
MSFDTQSLLPSQVENDCGDHSVVGRHSLLWKIVSQVTQAGRLTRSNFRLVRMFYGFAVISPALCLLGALVFSVCLLLAAFSL